MVVCVNNRPYLFTNLRIKRDSVPKKLFAYDVRDDDECQGTFAMIKDYILVNHWGTIIGKEKLPFDPKWQCYFPDEEKDGWFLNDYISSLNEYYDRYDKLQEECRTNSQ